MYKVENMKNCPFCDGKIYEWNDDYFACCHYDGCFLITGVNQDWRTENNVTVILKRKDYVDAWNKRPDLFEDWEPAIIGPRRTGKRVKCRIRSARRFRSTTFPGEFSDEDY